MKNLTVFVILLVAVVFATGNTCVLAQSYQLQSVWSDKCLDIDGNSGDINGANARQWDCAAGRANQLWQLNPLPNGCYQIISKSSGKCLDVDLNTGNYGKDDGANVHQWECLGENQTNQQWCLHDLGNGSYEIISLWSGKCLDVDLNTGNYGKDAGANVQQWTCVGTNQSNQHWRLVPDENALYPLGNEAYEYAATCSPVINKDPAKAKPLGVGPVAHGFNTLNFNVKFGEFSNPVDIYVALYTPALGADIWLITPGSALQPISQGLVPWKTATTGPIDESLFGEIPMWLFPAVPYSLYVMVTPAGSAENYYFWTTGFRGQYKIMDVSSTIVNSLGEQGFEALVIAMDSGYSLKQIADAAMSGRLLSSGHISDGSGGIETPVNPAYGIIIQSAATVQTFVEKFTDQETAAIMMKLITAIHDKIVEKNGGNWDDVPEATEQAIINGIFIAMQNAGYDFPDGYDAILGDRFDVVLDKKRGLLEAWAKEADGSRQTPTNPSAGVFADPVQSTCVDADNDDYYKPGSCPDAKMYPDCDDGNQYRCPGLLEVCGDGIDNDCDQDTDEQGCEWNCAAIDLATCGNSCIPYGNECCDTAGHYCNPGFYCTSFGCCKDGDLPCGTDCMLPDSVCCGGDHSCAAGYDCCGSGCMPAGYICKADPNTEIRYMLHDGIERSYRIHIPPGFENNYEDSLLLVLHGGGGTAENMEEYLTKGGFNRLSDEHEFIVVYPDGIEKHWNDGRKNVSWRSHTENIDDVGFISKIIDNVTEEFNLDPHRVFSTGISNGGQMSYRLACELTDKIAGIAPVAASLTEDLHKACSPKGAITVFIIAGTEDPLVPYEGGEISFFDKKFGKVISMPETVSFWVENNDCSSEPITFNLSDNRPGDGCTVECEKYIDGANGSEVLFYTIDGGGHTWPGGEQYFPKSMIGQTCRDFDACTVIWDFFKTHPKQ